MRSLWDVSNLFVCLILSNFDAVTSVVYVENGKSLTLNPNIQGTPEDILWTYNGNKVAERDFTEFQDYGQFRGRSEIEISTGRLTVRNMTSHDSGIYRSVIQINGKLQNSENEVKVIDAVQEPNVTCKLNKLSRTLLCSVSSQFKISYEWTGSGSAPQSGQELQISKEEKPDSVYTCTVKNEVSQKSSSFTVKDCDTEEDEKGTQKNMMEMSGPSGTRAPKNDSKEKRTDSEDGQVNEEQKVTENMNEGEMDPLVHSDARMKSDSEKEGDMSEEDEQ
ncbi:SLAM family member 5 isoform X2 [Megalobrama amblycephala]|uniref:SLAM family member 5 isoform X2 n=1 Tax=Megalobrama amblycephala TaxID=75352 RepID=UPI0020144D62|nr:SLAM family member 5 isoform X2 [Megalobrama amblycephala]